VGYGGCWVAEKSFCEVSCWGEAKRREFQGGMEVFLLHPPLWKKAVNAWAVRGWAVKEE
jgi:hypothetical protein